jgi:cytochrome c biogenesis protein CcmG, thiol:disulfide interchange protein DsbE
MNAVKALAFATVALFANPMFGSAAQAIEIGQKAPNFILKGADGKGYELNQTLAANKLTVVNFWATWCTPCMVEMPQFAKQYAVFKQNGAALLAVNSAEKEAVVTGYAARAKLPFPVIADPLGVAKEAYDVSALPVTLIIDSKGIVRDKIGAEQTAAQLIARVKTAAKKYN